MEDGTEVLVLALGGVTPRCPTLQNWALADCHGNLTNFANAGANWRCRRPVWARCLQRELVFTMTRELRGICTADFIKFVMMLNSFVVNPRLSSSPPLCSLWEKTCQGSVSVFVV